MKSGKFLRIVIFVVLALTLVSCEKTTGAGTTPAAGGTVVPTTGAGVPTPDGVLPCLTDCDTIKRSNVTSLQQLAQIGKGRIVDLAASPDSSELAVAVISGVYVYDTQTLEEITYIYDGSVMWSVAYSPDGADLAIGSDSAIHFYSTGDYTKRDTLTAGFGLVNDLAYAPDGSTLGAATAEQVGLLVNPLTLDYTLLPHEFSVGAVAYSPAGDVLYTAGRSTLSAWDTASGTKMEVLSPDGCNYSFPVATISGSGQNALACGTRIDLVENGAIAASGTSSSQSGAQSLVGDPSGSLHLALGRDDGTVEVWDSAALGAPLWTAGGHARFVNSLAFLPNGTILFSADDSEVKKWDALTGEDMGTINGFGTVINSFAVADSTGGLRIVNEGRVTELPPDACHGQLGVPALVGAVPDAEKVLTSDITEDGSLLVGVDLTINSSGYAFSIYVFDLELQQLRFRIPLGEGGHSTKRIAISPDGSLVATGIENNVVVYGMDGTDVALIPGSDYVSSVDFSPDGTSLVTTNSGGVAIYDTGTFTQKTYISVAGGNDVITTGFSSDANMFVTGLYNGDVRVYDLSTNTLYQTLEGGHSEAISSVIFADSDKMLVTAGWDRRVVFWDLETGEQLAWLQTPGNVTAMRLSGDERTISMAGYDGTLRVFGIPCETVEASGRYPRVIAGPAPEPIARIVSPSCIVKIAPPAGGTINYTLEEGFHVIDMPSGSTPDPKRTILWSNFTEATEGGGRIEVKIPEDNASVVFDDAGAVTVTIPGCRAAPN